MESSADAMKVLPMSSIAERSVNPIRGIVEGLKIPESTEDKKMIPLSIGDPCVFGNLKAPAVLIKAVQDAAADFGTHGYQHSVGMAKARAAVAARASRTAGREVPASDVMMTSGCSHALEACIMAMAGDGDNILLPKPSFALYETLAKTHGIEVRYYPLLPEKNWEADIEAMDKLVDARTRLILVNNPSNPCGSVYTKQHLLDTLEVAERHRVPILTDEIYGNLCFEGHEFFPMSSLTKSVPVVEVSGLSKEFICPGFRMGWIILHDVPATNAAGEPAMALDEIRKAIQKMGQLGSVPNSLVQAALPSVLDPAPGSPEEAEVRKHLADTLAELQKNALFLRERLGKVPGLKVLEPQGAMYVMVALEQSLLDAQPGMNDFTFVQQLLDEELVFLLPGRCFGIDNYMRVVFAAPVEVLGDACDRIERFCNKLLAAKASGSES